MSKDYKNEFFSTPAGEAYAAREEALRRYLASDDEQVEPGTADGDDQDESGTEKANVQEPPAPAPAPAPAAVAVQTQRVRVASPDDGNCIRFVHEDIPVQMAFTPEGASSKLVISMKAANVSDLDESVCLLVKSSDVSFTPPALCKFTIGVKGKEYRVMGVGVAHKIDNFTFIPLVKVIG